MNLQNILGAIETVDPEIYDRLDTRRHAMKQFTRVGGRIALSAIPFAIGAMFKKAYGQPSNPTVKGVLQYALTLEYIEAAFYNRGVMNAATIGITGTALTAISKIRDDENAHVNFLKGALTTGFAATAAEIASPNIDLTGGKSAAGTGPFAGAYQSGGYALFLGLAQTFEDTGVRAYKGRAKEITRGGDFLTAALQIHSVEARHAAHIRYMRSGIGGPTVPAGQTVKPWITQSQSGITVPGQPAIDTAISLSYTGATPESTSTQAGVPITNIGGQVISANAATEAFDEPLTAAEVLIIVNGFIY